MALDARYLKKHQRMLGGLYQSVLRSELTHCFGVEWGPIVNGQAEIAGVPKDLLVVFSKRAAVIEDAMAVKLDVFRHREGREPSPKERAALEREASADTRGGKSGLGVADLATRWRRRGSRGRLDRRTAPRAAFERAAADRSPTTSMTVSDVVEAVSAEHSSWGRPDVMQAICDLHRPVSQMSGHRWAAAIEHAADKLLERCVDLDPPDATQRRNSDGRSLWIEPTAPRFTSEAVLVQEERIITWAMSAQADAPSPSRTVERTGLDVLQADAASSVAGEDRVVLVVGPAGAGKTRMLAAAVNDLHPQHRAGVRGGTNGESSPRSSNGTPVCVPTPSPSCSMSGNGPTGRHYPSTGSRCRDDTRRRRGRDDLDPGASSARRLSPRRTSGASCWLVTIASCKPSAVAVCSPSCAPTAESTNSNNSTASNTMGGRRVAATAIR